MMYAKWNGQQFIIGFNPEIGGVKAATKRGLWRQIRRNAAFRATMNQYGWVRFVVADVQGNRHITDLMKDGSRHTQSA